MNRFDADTALERTADGVFAGRVSPSWSVGRGPNGGLIAALVMRALTLTVNDAAREPRSLTIHYLAPAEDGPVSVATTVERSGRSLTTLSARVTQGETLIALSLAAFAVPRQALELSEIRMPDVPSVEEALPFPPRFDAPPFTRNYAYRWAVGDPPFAGSQHARLGGWMRLAEPRRADAVAVAAMMDGWMPAFFPRLPQAIAPGVPTVDLTIHFRTGLPLPDAADDDYYLAIFTGPHVTNGAFIENGELWSQNGVLVAESRQLALVPTVGG